MFPVHHNKDSHVTFTFIALTFALLIANLFSGTIKEGAVGIVKLS